MCTSPHEAISRLLLELNHRSDRIMRLNNDEASGRDAAGRRRVSNKWDGFKAASPEACVFVFVFFLIILDEIKGLIIKNPDRSD